MDNQDYKFNETEYLNERQKRDAYVNERRKAEKIARARKQKLLLILILIGILVILISIVVGVVKLIIHKVSSNREVTPMSETLVVTEAIPDPTPTPTPDPSTLFLGYNETLNTENVMVHGTNIYSGYTVNKTNSTYYLDSENTLSTYAILIDLTNGDVVCEREGFTRINPASMTKVMTVLVAAEHLKEEDLDKTITIIEEDHGYVLKHDLSTVGFLTGETVTIRDLFYGTILPSGADAALALARYVAGSEEAFIDMMNEKANELGLKNTHFTNCVGLFNDDHYTTCAEMAMILKAAIENDFVYDVMNAHIYTTSKTAEHPDGIEISNWFLRRIEDKDTNGEVLCAKTGFVNESGCCAVSYSLQNSKSPYICVTANAWSSWRCIYDHVDIYYNNAS